MIRRIRVDYSKRGSPGVLIIVCNANGHIVFETKKAPLPTGRRREAKATRPGK